MDKHKSDTRYQRNGRHKEKQSQSITPTKVGIDVYVVNNIALNTESTIPIYDISRQNKNGEYLLSNDATSKTEIENVSEHIHQGDVGVEFILPNNDSSTRKNDKLGQKESGINYNHPDPPSQNIADNCDFAAY